MAKATNYYIYGLNTVLSVLHNAAERVLQLSVDRTRQDSRMQQLIDTAQMLGIKLQSVDAALFDKQLGEVNHQGVMALVKPAVPLKEAQLLAQLEQLSRPALLLVLDGVQDPHNLGACLRSADCAGADALIVPRDRACGLTATVCKVASGAAETVPFYTVTNLARSLRDLQQVGVWCIGMAGEAEAEYFSLELGGASAIVLGAEGRGLRRLTRETCDQLARLPMLGSVSSLNVSVTAGVCLYEALRQRHG